MLLKWLLTMIVLNGFRPRAHVGGLVEVYGIKLQAKHFISADASTLVEIGFRVEWQGVGMALHRIRVCMTFLQELLL